MPGTVIGFRSVFAGNGLPSSVFWTSLGLRDGARFSRYELNNLP
jgi:hypothetical protein